MVKKHKHGFTLIEVAVVIAVVAVLAAMVIVMFNVVQVQSRDRKREADMHSLIALFEAYYDTNGEYPTDASTQAQTLPGQTLDGKAIPSGDVITTSTTVAQLRTMLGEGFDDTFGDPRRPSPNALFRSIPNAVDANSPRYFYNGGAISLLPAGTHTVTATLNFTGKSGGTFPCRYQFTNTKSQSMSYLLGYYVEATDNWIYYHGRQGGKLQFNFDNNATCAARVTVKNA